MHKTWMTLTALLLASPAQAESVRETLQAFGLLGTWSIDCSADINRVCTNGRCFARVTFAASESGPVTRETVVPKLSDSGQIYKQTVEITSASRMSDDKIRMVFKLPGAPDNRLPNAPTGGEEWENVLLKDGNKLKGWASQRTDGGKVTLRNGQQVKPAPSSDASQPRQWISTGQVPPALERCSN